MLTLRFPLVWPNLVVRETVPRNRVMWLIRFVWLGLFAHVLWYVVRFGVRAPYQDEWYFTGVLADRSLNWEWVWALHSEHRYPLGKILYWILTTATGDFRTGALVTALLNGATAFALIEVARRVRGRASLVDILFPALMLNWGQFENYLFGYQVVFSLTAASMAVFLGAVTLFRHERAFGSGLAVGGSLLLVMQGGGYGLLAVPPMAVWIMAVAWNLVRRGNPRQATVLAAFPTLAAAYTALVISQFAPSADASPAGTIMGRVTVFLQAVGVGLGDGAATLGYPIPWLGGLLFVGYGIAIIRLGNVFLSRPHERTRSLGIAGVLAWSLASSLAIAMVRGAGFAPRYAGPAALGVCGLLLTAILYGPSPPPRLRWGVSLASVLLAAGLMLVNVPTARQVGKIRREHFKEFQRDLAEGVPATYLASKYGDIFFFPDRPLAEHIRPLATGRFPPFTSLRPEPTSTAIPLELAHPETLAARTPTASPSRLLWSGPSRDVLGVHLRYRLASPVEVLVLVVRDESGRVSAIYRRPASTDQEACFWIGRRVSELRLEPASLSPEIQLLSAHLEVPTE